MEFKYDPIPFIFKKGDSFTRLCILEMVDLWNTSAGKGLLLDLLKTQKKDGGFPSQIDSNFSGVKETERTANLLLRYKMPKDGLALTSCMKFLLRNQTEDGGFRENSKLIIPKKVVELSNQKGVTWLTADMVDIFRQMGQENTKACQKAINWLRKTEIPEGGWGLFEEDEEIDPDSSAQITFLMKDLLGEEDTLYKRGIALFEKHLDQMAQDAEEGFWDRKGEKEENEVYHLTHLLGQSIFSGKRSADAGYNIKDKRVKKIVEAIITIQRGDGGFRPFWSKKSDPLYTGLVLKIFLWVEAMGKKKIKSMIERTIFDTA
ncbi:MAG: terpene cyclase/mutase family protein [candidate division Zixibacteria bacterium]|nr:terpene cyclase/mutase family protein [candidate division Zixibacteria bacterium]